MHPSGTESSPRESGLPARNERHSPVWRPLLLGAWVEASGSSESGTPPETGINMTRSSTAKKSAGTLLIPVVGLYSTVAAQLRDGETAGRGSVAPAPQHADAGLALVAR